MALRHRDSIRDRAGMGKSPLTTHRTRCTKTQAVLWVASSTSYELCPSKMEREHPQISHRHGLPPYTSGLMPENTLLTTCFLELPLSLSLINRPLVSSSQPRDKGRERQWMRFSNISARHKVLGREGVKNGGRVKSLSHSLHIGLFCFKRKLIFIKNVTCLLKGLGRI